MTEKLYDKDAYATEFMATIVSFEPINDETHKLTSLKGDDLYVLVLDKTLFFPEEGGQTPDKGTIKAEEKSGSTVELEVVDVQIKEGCIYHIVANPAGVSLAEGKECSGVIDWKHRYNNMQQHSGEHIFSGLVHNTYGYDNVGFHLSDSVVTMDFNGPLTAQQIADIETRVNQAIYANIEIVPSFPTDEELEQIDYRSKKEINGQVRLVTIPGIDICACCAPHVHRTGEVGILKVVSAQNYKGGVRISILCGYRALELFRYDHELVTDIAAGFSTSADNIKGSIAKLQTELSSVKQSLIQARAELMEVELAKIPDDQQNVAIFAEEMDQNQMRNMVNSLVEKHSGYCAVFAGDDEKGYRYILGIKNGDARVALEKLKQLCQAKGGGSAQMIQGSLSGADKDTLKKTIEDMTLGDGVKGTF